MSLWLSVLAGCSLSPFNVGGPGGEADAVPLPVTFSGRYRVTVLAVLTEPDTNGDGVIDNALPDGLALLDLAVPDSGFATGPFNERLADHITNLRPIFIDVEVAEGLQLDVLDSEVDEDGVVQIFESQPATLRGTIADDGEFEAGPGDVTLEVVLRDDMPAVPLGLLETLTTGELYEEAITGILATLISIDSVVADVIEPSVPDEGWDIDRDGIPEPKAEVMDIVSGLAGLLADTTLEDGSPAISAVLAFDAEISE